MIARLRALRAMPEPHERRKLGLLSLCFFCVIATYSVLRPLKVSVFAYLVGVEYQPLTKFITILLMFPAMIFYAYLVDKIRRYQVLYFFLCVYAALCLLFCYFLLHPVYGLTNTHTSPWRILGWAFYILLDLYPVFVVSTFWAFSGSIFSPTEAKNSYGFIVAASKMAGITSPLLSSAILTANWWPHTTVIPWLVGSSAILLLMAATFIAKLIRTVPGQFLHGYEAVYQLEKEKSKQKTKKKGFAGLFEGIRLMITQPYVFGIFGLVYSYELISSMLDYQMQFMVRSYYHNNVGEMSKFFLNYTASFQGVGLLFAIFGTSTLLRKLDVQFCLVSVPLITSGLVVGLLMFPSLTTMFVVMVVLRGLNYGFNTPIREILYIPTVKNIKFKSKAWIDSFGRTISKGSGASVNLLAQSGGSHAVLATGCSVSLVVVVVWTFIALSVSRKYMTTVSEGKAIGNDD